MTIGALRRMQQQDLARGIDPWEELRPPMTRHTQPEPQPEPTEQVVQPWQTWEAG
jgi:hypothetical protein